MQQINYALCFKALGDETRIKIICLLECGSLCACKILEHLSISQSTLSYHMKHLTESGIVDVEKEGTWNYYSLNNEVLNALSMFLSRQGKCKILECYCNGKK